MDKISRLYDGLLSYYNVGDLGCYIYGAYYNLGGVWGGVLESAFGGVSDKFWGGVGGVFGGGGGVKKSLRITVSDISYVAMSLIQRLLL